VDHHRACTCALLFCTAICIDVRTQASTAPSPAPISLADGLCSHSYSFVQYVVNFLYKLSVCTLCLDVSRWSQLWVFLSHAQLICAVLKSCLPCVCCWLRWFMLETRYWWVNPAVDNSSLPCDCCSLKCFDLYDNVYLFSAHSSSLCYMLGTSACLVWKTLSMLCAQLWCTAICVDVCCVYYCQFLLRRSTPLCMHPCSAPFQSHRRTSSLVKLCGKMKGSHPGFVSTAKAVVHQSVCTCRAFVLLASMCLLRSLLTLTHSLQVYVCTFVLIVIMLCAQIM